MGIFRFAVVVLAVVGAVSILTQGGAWLAWLGAAMLLPLLLIKVFFLAAFFGLAGKAMRRGRRGPWTSWSSPPRRRSEERPPSDEQRFEEWHRMAHARDEVRSWTPEV